MFGPARISASENNQQQQKSVAGPDVQPKPQPCAVHSVVKNIPTQPKPLTRPIKLTKSVRPARVAPKAGRLSTDPALQGLAVRPTGTTRVRTPYLGQTPLQQINIQQVSQPKSKDLEVAQEAAKKLAGLKQSEASRKAESQFTDIHMKEQHKSPFFRRMFHMSANELKVFAAGVFFASGLIVIGFYIGVSSPEAAAGTNPETYQVELASQGAAPVVVDVEVDAGIDIEDVDWRPPMPITADMPSRLIIPKFDTNAPVRSLGLTRSGALAVPNYTNQVGWYDQSARPGQAGTVVMDGHYGVPAGSAVFGRFGELTTGDVVQIQRGDGQVLSYAIEEIGSYTLGEVPMDRLIASDSTERLNLITCSGGWNDEAHTYDSRTIVFAKRI